MTLKIKYLNTDLDIQSDEDLRTLVRALSRKGLFSLHDFEKTERGWFASLETCDQYRSPELTIKKMLDAIDRLGKASYAVWQRCSLREFNIGYDCGDKPWAFNQGLSNKTLRRMAEHGATLRITLYPPCPDDSSQSQH